MMGPSHLQAAKAAILGTKEHMIANSSMAVFNISVVKLTVDGKGTG